MDKQAKIENAVKAATEVQIRDDVCSRSTMYGLQTVLDKISDDMVTATASLCGGTGSAGCSCGAYCAGLLAVGLKYNSTMEEEQENEEAFGRTAEKFMEFRDRFVEGMGTCMCREILEKKFGRKYDLADPEDNLAFLNLEGHAESCAETVAFATRLAAEMILADE